MRGRVVNRTGDTSQLGQRPGGPNNVGPVVDLNRWIMTIIHDIRRKSW